jgi:hypothetical protein
MDRQLLRRLRGDRDPHFRAVMPPAVENAWLWSGFGPYAILSPGQGLVLNSSADASFRTLR